VALLRIFIKKSIFNRDGFFIAALVFLKMAFIFNDVKGGVSLGF
jgi:hypothetical protein